MSVEAENAPAVDSALLAKLQNYALVSSALDYYQTLKGSSALATVCKQPYGMHSNSL